MFGGRTNEKVTNFAANDVNSAEFSSIFEHCRNRNALIDGSSFGICSKQAVKSCKNWGLDKPIYQSRSACGHFGNVSDAGARLSFNAPI